MDDLISRQAVLDELRKAEDHAFNTYYKGLVKAHKIIADMPSAENIGYWENHFDEDNEINGYVCSECKKAFFYDEITNFCPHCGLRMIDSIEEGWW